MAELTFAAAIALCLCEEMERDDRVCVLGQEVGVPGGVYGATSGLLERFGKDRVKDVPISEVAILGATAGAAMVGLRPVAEIMHSGLLAVAWDMVVNQIAKAHYMSAGQVTMPLVIRSANGSGDHTGPQLAQNVENWALTIPGIKVVIPSNPRDAKGLLAAAIRDDSPVLFLEHKALYDTTANIPEGELLTPIGKADVLRDGHDVTVTAVGAMVPLLLAAATKLEAIGVDVAVIDMRTLAPLDTATVIESAAQTRRVLIVEDAPGFCGWGAELAFTVTRSLFRNLKAPVARLRSPNIPAPAAPNFEMLAIPSTDRIVESLLRVAQAPPCGAFDPNASLSIVGDTLVGESGYDG